MFDLTHARNYATRYLIRNSLPTEWIDDCVQESFLRYWERGLDQRRAMRQGTKAMARRLSRGRLPAEYAKPRNTLGAAIRELTLDFDALFPDATPRKLAQLRFVFRCAIKRRTATYTARKMRVSRPYVSKLLAEIRAVCIAGGYGFDTADTLIAE